jgi:hypothetical protein
MAAWYFHGQFERLGPFTSEALRQMVADGTVEPCQVVWEELDHDKFYIRADRAMLFEDGQAPSAKQVNGKALDQTKIQLST